MAKTEQKLFDTFSPAILIWLRMFYLCLTFFTAIWSVLYILVTVIFFEPENILLEGIPYIFLAIAPFSVLVAMMTTKVFYEHNNGAHKIRQILQVKKNTIARIIGSALSTALISIPIYVWFYSIFLTQKGVVFTHQLFETHLNLIFIRAAIVLVFSPLCFTNGSQILFNLLMPNWVFNIVHRKNFEISEKSTLLVKLNGHSYRHEIAVKNLFNFAKTVNVSDTKMTFKQLYCKTLLRDVFN